MNDSNANVDLSIRGTGLSEGFGLDIGGPHDKILRAYCFYLRICYIASSDKFSDIIAV